MSEWQKIETAPTDQRSILGAHVNSGIRKVCWRFAVGDDRYEYGAGPERLWRPTHWQQLPAAPKRSSPEAGKQDPRREEVLLAFAVEPSHDRTTLERYLKAYPQYAEDFADILSELRRGPAGHPVKDDEGAAERAWNHFSSVPTDHEEGR